MYATLSFQLRIIVRNNNTTSFSVPTKKTREKTLVQIKRCHTKIGFCQLLSHPKLKANIFLSLSLSLSSRLVVILFFFGFVSTLHSRYVL